MSTLKVFVPIMTLGLFPQIGLRNGLSRLARGVLITVMPICTIGYSMEAPNW